MPQLLHWLLWALAFVTQDYVLLKFFFCFGLIPNMQTFPAQRSNPRHKQWSKPQKWHQIFHLLSQQGTQDYIFEETEEVYDSRKWNKEDVTEEKGWDWSECGPIPSCMSNYNTKKRDWTGYVPGSALMCVDLKPIISPLRALVFSSRKPSSPRVSDSDRLGSGTRNL